MRGLVWPSFRVERNHVGAGQQGMKRAEFITMTEDGIKVITQVIVADVDEWSDMPESASPLWGAVIISNTVIAHGCTVDDRLVERMTSTSTTDARRN